MISNFSELVLLYVIYSILGWIVKSIFFVIEEKKFVKQGFLYGPYLPIYGFGIIINLIITKGFAHSPILVFLVFFTSMTLMEFLSGMLFEALFKVKLWDYKKRKFNLIGHTYLTNSVIFGFMGLLAVYFVQPQIHSFFLGTHPDIIRFATFIFVAIMFLDLARSLVYASDYKVAVDRFKEDASRGKELTQEEILWIVESAREEFQRDRYRFKNPLKALLEHVKEKREVKREALIDSYAGLDVTKIVWIFLIGSVVGYIIETLFCFATLGVVESRQGMIYGPFSQIYGFGAILMVLLLTPLVKKGDSYIFVGGAMVGGLYEAVCSIIQENTIGSISWDYQAHAYPLFGGRTSIMYMMFWGILAIVYMKYIYPMIERLIGRIPFQVKHFFTWIIVAVLSVDLVISGLAVNRWSDRVTGEPAKNNVERWLDYKYPNNVLKEIYPRMKLKR